MMNNFNNKSMELTSFQQDIEKLTDGNQSNEDWGLIMKIYSYIAINKQGAEEAMQIIRKRLQINPITNGWHTIKLTLILLDALTKNCGKYFHLQIVQKDFLKEFQKIFLLENIPPKDIQDKVLNMIQTWTLAFRHDPDLNYIEQFYQECKQQGLEFPPIESEMIFKETISDTPQPMIDTNSHLNQSLSDSIKQQIHREQLLRQITNLDTVQTNGQVLPEISIPLQSNEEHQQDLDLLMNQSKDLAVCVKDLSKTYGYYLKSTKVLHDINLNVPRGIIYGLLGPSGCGKTTLLRCIAGRLGINNGEINVLGRRPNSRGHEIPGKLIGYMPQETALYKDFTISEMFHHFGRIHNMNNKDILSREEFLLSYLDLPCRTKNISQLSGGQKRRVSLGCALFQQPQLLILDEPTVGVDPLLREKIWIHLINISKTNKTTIIITTHYIDEARKADYVGIMRNGRVLAEDKPSFLLNKYNETSLENVFLQLCFNDQNRIEEKTLINNHDKKSSSNSIQISTNTINHNIRPETHQQKTHQLCGKRVVSDYCKCPRWHKIFALIIKDLTVIKRNIGFLFFTFLIPVLIISLFCLFIGHDPQYIQMALYNNEAINGFPTGNLSLNLLNKINSKQIHFTSFNDFDKAINSVKQGHYWGVAAIQFDFTQAIHNKFLLFDTSSYTLNSSSIHLYLDMTSPQMSSIMQWTLFNSTHLFLKEYLTSQKIDPLISDPPVIIEKSIYENKSPEFLNYTAPGIILLIIFALAIALTSIMFISEKKEGLLERSWIAGITTTEVMISHIIVNIFVQIIQIILLIIFANFVFKIEIKGSILLVIGLIFIEGICGMNFGLLISSVCENEIEVTELALGIFFSILLSSGIIWPIDGMSKLVRYLSNLSPLTHGVEAMRCIALRGWTFMYFKVYFGFLMSAIWTLAYFVLANIIFSLRK